MAAPEAIAMRKILIAIDLSAGSEDLFQAAQALAQHYGARLHLIHVVAFPSLRKAGLAKLKVFAEANKAEGTDLTITVAVGMASSEIVSYAEREQIDLIVMGTHGRTGLVHMLMGSVAEAVVRTAPCQVLTTKLHPGLRVGVPDSASRESQAPSVPQHCLVCAEPSEVLVCESCKAKIRGEALERKSQAEKAGRKGLPV